MTPDQITATITARGGATPTPAQVALVQRFPCVLDLVFPASDLFTHLFTKA